MSWMAVGFAVAWIPIGILAGLANRNMPSSACWGLFDQAWEAGAIGRVGSLSPQTDLFPPTLRCSFNGGDTVISSALHGWEIAVFYLGPTIAWLIAAVVSMSAIWRRMARETDPLLI